MAVNCIKRFSEGVVDVSMGGITGCLGAHWFTKLNPMNGAVHGVVYAIVCLVANFFFQSIFKRSDVSNESKGIAMALNLVICITASSAICAAFGVQLTLQTTCVLIICQAFTQIIRFCCNSRQVAAAGV